MVIVAKRTTSHARRMFNQIALWFCLSSTLLASSGATPPAKVSTAWRTGRFHVNVAGVLSRSDILLQRPNTRPEEAMPLGNGRLGAAVWSQDGFTAQLNRADTLPLRLSPGQVVIPGLKRLVDAPDYSGRLSLYNGEFIEHGGRMSATVYVEPNRDLLVIDVSGADPKVVETATLQLWKPRHPVMTCRAGVCVASEVWQDTTEAGASGETFGSLAAITARARHVRATADGPFAVKVSFQPWPDGTFRVLVAAPEWKGGNAIGAASQVLSRGLTVSPATHRQWWNNFWRRAGLMKLSSEDHSAEYFENLRAIDLYTAAAESRGRLPGSQAGVGDLFSAFGDTHQWDPSAYWHWNLRMQVAANLGAGLYKLNEPYFNLYRSNLPNIKVWTRARMEGRPGACVPETMRFNGQGYENETWAAPALDCSAHFKPYYNARTLTTGAEVSLWVWRQYLATDDRAFLAANYPIMAASARFLLAYTKRGADGLLHTYPSNAHETQWDVHDPTTDIAAMKALFPVVIQAARMLNTDPLLVRHIKAAMPHLLPFPRTDEASELLYPADDAAGADVIAPSYDPAAPLRNSENIGLEPVWPYDLIGDHGPLHDLALRTFRYRPFKIQNDWSFDPIQAARLGLATQVQSTLTRLTEKYQAYPSGLAHFVGQAFYVEQVGVVAEALQEALVQDDNGVVLISPAWPKDWDADATVYIRHRTKVDVQVRRGIPVTVAIEAGESGVLLVRNPWPGRMAEAVSGKRGDPVAEANGTTATLDIPVKAGRSYLLQPRYGPNSRLPFEKIGGSPAIAPRCLGGRCIGLVKTPGLNERQTSDRTFSHPSNSPAD